MRVGGEVGADNPDQSAVREARHHVGRERQMMERAREGGRSVENHTVDSEVAGYCVVCKQGRGGENK